MTCVFMCAEIAVGEISGADDGGAMSEVADVGRVRSACANSGGDGEDCSSA